MCHLVEIFWPGGIGIDAAHWQNTVLQTLMRVLWLQYHFWLRWHRPKCFGPEQVSTRILVAIPRSRPLSDSIRARSARQENRRSKPSPPGSKMVVDDLCSCK